MCGFFFRRVPTGARLKGATLKLDVYDIINLVPFFYVKLAHNKTDV